MRSSETEHGPSKLPGHPYKGYWCSSLEEERADTAAYKARLKREVAEQIDRDLAALEKKLGYSLRGDTTTPDTPPQKP